MTEGWQEREEFAQWIVENKPNIAVGIIADAIVLSKYHRRLFDRLFNWRHSQDDVKLYAICNLIRGRLETARKIKLVEETARKLVEEEEK